MTKSSSVSTTHKEKESLLRLTGVGPQLAKKLERIGLHKISDLLFHLPYRYQDRTRITPIGALSPGLDAVILGQVEAADIRFGKRRSMLVKVSDNTGTVLLRFFHFNASQKTSFQRGIWIQCFGEPRRSQGGIEMVHPEYRLHQDTPENITNTSLTPVYPATEGVGPTTIRKLADQALKQCEELVSADLPDQLMEKYRLIPLAQALRMVHAPPADSDTEALLAGQHTAQKRLALDELLAHHMALYRLREGRRSKPAPLIEKKSTLWNSLLNSLEFSLTHAQSRVINEIIQDFKQPSPIMRLIQGDVGCGKTIVAAAAALFAIESGYQVALMSPTELLTDQHNNTFSTWFEKLAVQIDCLTGKLPVSQRREVLERIHNGASKFIIGTHALFQDDVQFNNLGLIIVDEQHRFGVGQRLALHNKGQSGKAMPHQIIMSATPIPRSLAMIFYADLDVSNIDEMPPGRIPVTTVAIPDDRRGEIIDRVRSACANGNQVYWVCPLIEESDKLNAQSAIDTQLFLQESLSHFNVSLIHGRMKPSEKEQVMEQFRQGKSDLLVATTVIEVGVDVPNANLMIIENAERLGLAQLHQLRGRVGRGNKQASCVLIYQSPLGKLAKDRLSIMRETNDGFEIARKDLEHRGPGEMLGTRQTGSQQMKIANIVRDRALLPDVENIATELRSTYPDFVDDIINRWIHENENYANV